jgi:hypothetical protein
MIGAGDAAGLNMERIVPISPPGIYRPGWRGAV